MGDEQPLVAGGDKGFTKLWKILIIVNILVLIGLTIIVIYYSVSVSNPKYYTKSATNNDIGVSFFVLCDSGDQFISGGCGCDGSGTVVISVPASRGGWICNCSGTKINYANSVYVLCLKSP